jgi:hypothetical protein
MINKQPERQVAMADIATRKLFENDKVAVWEMTLAPGESSGVHTHRRDVLFHVIEGSTLQVSDASGTVLVTHPMPPDFTILLKCEGDELTSELVRLPATHETRNVGETRYREFVVELK